MSKNRLQEYFASIGSIETSEAEKRQEEIIKAKSLVISNDGSPEIPPEIKPPPFQPRHEVSKLFKRFSDDFTKNYFTITANEKGVDLHWVGIGTWKTPDDVAPARHLDAWKLSRENASRGNAMAMNALRKEALIRRTIREIQDVPLARFTQSVKMKKHKDAIQDLLLAYREQLIEAVELLDKSDKPAPVEILQAIKHLEIVAKIPHWVGGASRIYLKEAHLSTSKEGFPRVGISQTAGIPSTRPSPEDETRLFQILIDACGGDEEAAERCITNERKQYPHTDRKVLIEHAIERMIRDRN